MNCNCKTPRLSGHQPGCVNRPANLAALERGLSFKLDGSNLVPYENDVPLEPVDLTDLVQASETDTRLTLDLEARTLVYRGERTNTEGASPDTIPFSAIAATIDLNDLADVRTGTPNEGDLLVQSKGEWVPYTIPTGQIVSSVGLDSAGLPVKASPGSASSQAPSVPVGGSILWSGAPATVPAGFAIEDGRQLNRSVYATLFGILGTIWGVGNGTNTFNIPDSRNRTSVGVGSDEHFDTLGEASGQARVTLSQNEMPSHSHGVDQSPHAHGFTRDSVVTSAGGNNRVSVGGSGQQVTWSAQGMTAVNANIGIQASGGNGSHDNVQPSIARYYIMRII